MHHKRGRAKNRRAGCLSCKPWKMNGAKDPRPANDVKRMPAFDDMDGCSWWSSGKPCQCDLCLEEREAERAKTQLWLASLRDESAA